MILLTFNAAIFHKIACCTFLQFDVITSGNAASSIPSSSSGPNRPAPAAFPSPSRDAKALVSRVEKARLIASVIHRIKATLSHRLADGWETWLLSLVLLALAITINTFIVDEIVRLLEIKLPQ